jgi:hypothetical protein
MRRTNLIAAGVLAGALSLALSPAGAGNNGNGNGAPKGSHYNLNIIGVPNAKKAAMDDSNRHTIFVPLKGSCKINLAEGDYNVADGNCFDGDGAELRLPDPDPDGDGVTAYSVYARALGKPGGSAVATSCITDAAGETWCSTENVVLVRSTGQSTFKNVSKELLTVCLDTDGDGTCDEREFLFDDSTHDYFWQYDNNGLRLAQLRFYEVPTDVGLNP